MEESTDNFIALDVKAIGKKASKQHLYQLEGNVHKHSDVVRMIQKRELFGPSPKLSNIRCRVIVDSMLQPKIRNSFGLLESYMKYTLLMGLSTDSGYVLCLVFPDLCSFDRFLIIAYVTPTCLVPQYTVSVRERQPTDNFYASFSKDSNIVSVIVSPKLPSTDKSEPYFFDTNIYLLNLKRELVISLSATIRASCRWNNHKLDRVCLRSTDYGAVLNSGLSIVALIFLPTLSSEVDVVRNKVFLLQKSAGAGYERSVENLESTVVINGGRKMNLSYKGCKQEEEYSFVLVKEGVTNEYIKKGMCFVMSTTEVSSFIKTGTNKLLRYLSFNVGQIKCVDYELDIIECTSDYWVYSLVTTLIEVTTDGKAATYVVVFAVNINVMTRASNVSIWRKLRAVNVCEAKGTSFFYRRDKWYPFGEKRVKNVEERIVSDECLSSGESASLLSAPFPGIELEKSFIL